MSFFISREREVKTGRKVDSIQFSNRARLARKIHKHETRISKSETNPNESMFKCSKLDLRTRNNLSAPRQCFRHWKIRICFGFRPALSGSTELAEDLPKGFRI